jgi:hypothetical protein
MLGEVAATIGARALGFDVIPGRVGTIVDVDEASGTRSLVAATA